MEEKEKAAELLPIEIVPVGYKEITPVYANFVNINHTPFDFTLTFCEASPVYKDELEKVKESARLEAPTKARIVIPANLVPALISALQENYDKYKDSFLAKEEKEDSL